MERIQFIDNITLGGLIDEVNVERNLNVKAVNETRTIAVVGKGKGVNFVNDFSLLNVGVLLKTVKRFDPQEVNEDEYQFYFTKPASKLKWVKGSTGIARTIKSDINIDEFIRASSLIIDNEEKIKYIISSLDDLLSYDIEGFVVFEENENGVVGVKIAKDEYSNMIEKVLFQVSGEVSPFFVRILKDNVKAVINYLVNSNLDIKRIIIGSSIPLIIMVENEIVELSYLISNVVEVEE